MENFYKGDEVKFAINLTAPGFSMDENSFDIEVASPKNSIKASKAAPSLDLALRIFRESDDTSSDSSSSDSSSSSSDEGEGTWYAIVDTTNLSTGELRVIATAYVPDGNANDYVRRQSAVRTLGMLKNK